VAEVQPHGQDRTAASIGCIAGLPAVGQVVVQEGARRDAAGTPRIGTAYAIQVLLCIVPTSALLTLGEVELAGQVFFALVGLLFMCLVVFGRQEALLCLLVSLAPFISLLRQSATHNIVVVLYGVALLYYYCRDSAAFRDVVFKRGWVRVLLLFIGSYYALSLLFTGEYSTNLRMFDMGFAVIAVLILGRKQDLLRAALLGLAVSTVMLGLALLAHFGGLSNERLGLFEAGGQRYGNPAQLGTALAFCCLSLTIDGGRWLGLEGKAYLRYLLLLVVLSLLALSTSRAAWLVWAGGMLVAILVGKRQRMVAVCWIIALIALGCMLLSSRYGEALEGGLNRTFDLDRPAAKITSGRSEQWLVAYYIITDSAENMLWGCGPGTGPSAFATYLGRVPGVEFGVWRPAALHSLYMQVAVEAGLVGLTLVLLWLGAALLAAVRYTRVTRNVLPLASLLGYGLIALTVSGNDTHSGIFLGVGLIGACGIEGA